MNLRPNNLLVRLKNSPELKKSIIYTVASTVGFGIVLIQNFSLAFFTSVSFFGKVTLLVSLFSTLYVIFTFGMNAVVMRYYFDKSYTSDKRKLLSNVVTIWFLLGIVIVLVLLALGYGLLFLQRLLPLDYHTEFVPVLIGAFLFSSTEIFPSFFVAGERPQYYALTLIGGRLTTFVLLHLGLYLYGESAHHISMMLLWSGVVIFLANIILFRLYSVTNVAWRELKEILVYAFPLMIYALGGIGYSHGYRVVISKWLTYEDLAIFTMANQIAMIYYLIAASCVVGFQPKAYRTLEAHDGRPRAIRFYLQILLAVGVGLMLLILPLSYVFFAYFKGGSFLAASRIAPILVFGQFIYFLYGYNYILSTFYKKTRLLTYSMVAGVSTSLILTSVLLDTSSLWGATVPVVTGILVQFVLSLVLVRKISYTAAPTSQ